MQFAWASLKRLALGLFLIAAACAVLLLSDWSHRQSSHPRVRIALVQHASQTIIEDGIQGLLEALAQHGFVDGRTADIRRYNAEGDMPTATAIANEVVNGGYDLLLTVTTLSLQSVANANRAGKTQHVFALVSDPASAGVGIHREAPLEHPAHLAGYGTLQPVAETLQLAKQMLPSLTRVGVVWNPAEANSEANLKLARQACAELQLELLEANAENTAAVADAANSLTARAAQAIWVGGDVTAMTAMDSIVTAARRARIPVFTSMPGSVDRGALFDLGANYHEVGRLAGELAARVLAGTSPATIPITNVMPETLLVNPKALADLKDAWQFPPDMVARASKGAASPALAAQTAALTKVWKLHIIDYIDVQDSEEAQRGIHDGLRAAGLVEGRDFTTRTRNAQGDMPTVSTLIDAAVTEGTDLLMILSTPTLQAALQRGRGKPIVFTFVANPIAAGAGRSNEDHLPNVTGVPTIGAYDQMMQLVRECLPSARRIGTLFVPAEVNSVYNRTVAEAEAKKRGLELVALPVNTSTEIADAALSLAGGNIDAIAQIGSNLTTVAFASISKAADRARLPLFGVLTSNSTDGAAVVIARDYYDGGVRAGHIAARVMRGESPEHIPFEPLSTTRILINREAAQRQGLVIPAAILQRAEVDGKK